MLVLGPGILLFLPSPATITLVLSLWNSPEAPDGRTPGMLLSKYFCLSYHVITYLIKIRFSCSFRIYFISCPISYLWLRDWSERSSKYILEWKSTTWKLSAVVFASVFDRLPFLIWCFPLLVTQVNPE